MLFFLQFFRANCFGHCNIKEHSLFLIKFFRYIFQPVWNTFYQTCFVNFSNHSTEQEWPPSLIGSENAHVEDLNLPQINNEIVSPPELVTSVITRAISAQKLFDQIFAEVRLHHSSISEKLIVEEPKSPTQTISVSFHPNKQNTETTESIFHIAVREVSPVLL